MKELLRREGIKSLCFSILFIVLGIIMILNSNITIKFISFFLGILFILIGILKIIRYIRNKFIYSFYNYDLIIGILEILVGIFIMIFNTQITSLIRGIIGFWIIILGITKLNFSIKFKKYSQSKTWIVELILAILLIICGIYISFKPGIIIFSLGVIIIIYAILDIIEKIVFLEEIKKL